MARRPPRSLRTAPCSVSSSNWALRFSVQDMRLEYHLALDDTDGSESRDLAGNARAHDDVDDVLYVLVGLRHLLLEGVTAGGARGDSRRAELVPDPPTARGFHRGGAA